MGCAAPAPGPACVIKVSQEAKNKMISHYESDKTKESLSIDLINIHTTQTIPSGIYELTEDTDGMCGA